jgi:hypothetical protein
MIRLHAEKAILASMLLAAPFQYARAAMKRRPSLASGKQEPPAVSDRGFSGEVSDDQDQKLR